MFVLLTLDGEVLAVRQSKSGGYWADVWDGRAIYSVYSKQNGFSPRTRIRCAVRAWSAGRRVLFAIVDDQSVERLPFGS